MAKIIIDISDDEYAFIKETGVIKMSSDVCIARAIINGIVLPKGHGRLIDADKLKTHFIGTEQGTDLEVYLEPTIINAPTIIEADKDDE